MRPRLYPGFLISTLALFLLPPASPADAGTGLFGRPITRIEYSAELPLDRTHYDGAIGLKPGDILTHAGVRGAMQALYDTGRFSTIAAESRESEGGVELLFRLSLNSYFNSFAILGKVDLKGRSPAEAISLPVGERFTAQRQEEALRAVEGFLKEQGYFQGQVKLRTESELQTRQVDTVYEVQPGRLARIAKIDIRGVPPVEVPAIRSKFGFKVGKPFNRSLLRKRLDGLKQYLMGRGYLAAAPNVSESYDAEANTVALALEIRDFGKVRVAVSGFKIDRGRLRRLLPVLSGEGLQPDLLQEGERSLLDYLDQQGYPEAAVSIREDLGKSGVRILRHEIDSGKKVAVATVGFQGNRSIPEKDLLAVLQIQRAGFMHRSVYSVAKLDSDVESLRTLYHSRGYLQAVVIPLVTASKGAGRLAIKFECREGPLSTVRSEPVLQGNMELSADALRSRMSLRPGAPYSPNILERDRQALLAAYNDAGFLQARVIYRAGSADENNTYPVEFEIFEGMRSLVDSVLVLGNRHTRDSIINKRILLRKGSPLSLGKVLETQQALYNTGIFERVRVAPQNPDSVTPFQDVVVRLEEAKRFTIRYGLGYQEREHVRGTIEFSDLNILGTGQRADLRFRGSRIEQIGVLSLQQPQFRYLPVNSYFTLYGQQKREVSFDVKRFSVSYQLSRPLGSHSWALARYNFRNVHVSNIKDTQPGRDDTPRNLSTISAIYINDTRDNYLDPEKGFFTSTDLSLTTKLIGSNNFYSLFTQNTYHRRLTGSLLGSAAFRFGFIQPFGGDTDIPISEKHFAGGASSLRGFDTDRAGPINPDTLTPEGGNALIIFNLEARVPLLRPVYLAGFYDTGNVFTRLSTVSFSGFSQTVGLGLRIKTPFGPLRLDYGFNLNLPGELKSRGFKTRHLYFTVGPAF